MNFLKKLSLQAKFYLLVSSFLIPFLTVVYFLIQVSTANINFNTKEVQGTRLLVPTFGLMASLAGGRSDLADWEAQIRENSEVFPQLGWTDFRLLEEKTVPENLSALSAAVVSISDASNLTLDPDLDTYYLMNLAVFQLVPLWNRLVAIESTQATGGPGEATRQELKTLLLQVDLSGVETSVSTILRQDPAFNGSYPGLADRLNQMTPPVLAGIRSLAAALGSGGSAQASELKEMTERLWLSVVADLGAMCQLRVDRYSSDLTWSLAFSGLAVVLGLTLMGIILWSTLRQIHALNRTSTALVEGDFTRETVLMTSDELGEVARKLNSVTEGLRTRFQTMDQVLSQLAETAGSTEDLARHLEQGLVTQTEASGRITQGVVDLAAAAQHLGETAQSQVKEAASGAAVLAKLSEGSRALSAEASQASRTSRDRSQAAKSEVQGLDEGLNRFELLAETLSELDRAMGEIEGESQKMDAVLSGLTEIASRTGILAMNASIEAAHAGLSGKGFAVIADEVRKLADQANEAATASSTLLGGVRQRILGLAHQSQVASAEATSFAEVSRRVRDQLQKLSVELDQSASVLAGVEGRMQEQSPILADLERQSRVQGDLALEAGTTSTLQAQGTVAIQASLEELSQLNRQTAASATHLSRLSEALRKESRTLESMVSSLRY